MQHWWLCESLLRSPERNPEDRGQEEAHLQASAGRVHRPREDRERVRAQRRSSSALCTRRQPAGREEEMWWAGTSSTSCCLTVALPPPSGVWWQWWCRTRTSWPAGPREPWDWMEPTRNSVTLR